MSPNAWGPNAFPAIDHQRHSHFINVLPGGQMKNKPNRCILLKNGTKLDILTGLKFKKESVIKINVGQNRSEQGSHASQRYRE